MPPRCCVAHCSSRMNKNEPQLSFHRMPKNELLRKKWIDIIGEEHIISRQKDLFVCSLHFDESSFNRTLNILRLHDNTVPTLFMNKKSRPFFKHKSTSHVQPKGSCPPTSVKMNNKSRTSFKHDSTSHMQPKESCALTDVKHTDKQERSILYEESIKQQAHLNSTALITMLNEDIDIQRNNEKIKTLSLRCNNQRSEIKRLREMVRRRNKKVTVLKEIIDNLKKTHKINNE